MASVKNSFSDMKLTICGALCFSAVICSPRVMADSPSWDTFSDTWVATDALGRTLPTFDEIGGPRADRTVGIFYFIWLGEHIQGGPYDVTKILEQDSGAILNKESPLWGRMHAPHHWGESIFDYYITNDESVLRKHAQMLSDAGVDMVVFDVTNQITYRKWYTALFRVWSEMREMGNRTPQVAFLCPFWDPHRVVHELWRDLYSKGLYRDLWFEWEGKPLILADRERSRDRIENARKGQPTSLEPGKRLGQSFEIDQAFVSVESCFPTWKTKEAGLTLTLRQEGPGGKEILRKRFEQIRDNGWLTLEFPSPQPAGRYYLEASDPVGRVGWWSQAKESFNQGQAFADDEVVPGDRTIRVVFMGEADQTIREFFTFRKPQPDYFRGPTQPNMWGWLEVSPQHVFLNERGEKEQMTVGVAQNAVDGRLGSMSEKNALGRSFHDGAFDKRPDAVLHGYNFAEQWDRALQEDPRFIFITGWNEWIMGRFDSFNGIDLPVMFVDQFDQEHSRDIEPMKGGHGDNYFYQAIDNIRRYKGVRRMSPVKSRPIAVDGEFDDWGEVQPEFRDTIGDPVRRQHRGWNPDVQYTNDSGRNDIVAAKFSCTDETASFYVRTRETLTAYGEPNWMTLYIDVDANTETGWLGYDFAVNRVRAVAGETTLERCAPSGTGWSEVSRIPWSSAENEFELSLPWAALGCDKKPGTLDFKWADNTEGTGEWSDFTRNGDAAPNDRFNYRALLGPVR